MAFWVPQSLDIYERTMVSGDGTQPKQEHDQKEKRKKKKNEPRRRTDLLLPPPIYVDHVVVDPRCCTVYVDK